MGVDLFHSTEVTNGCKLNCNPGENILYKVEKSSNVGQDFKSFLSNFACFLTAIVKV